MRKLTSKPAVIVLIFVAALLFLFKQRPGTEEQQTVHRIDQEAIVAKAKEDVKMTSQDSTQAQTGASAVVYLQKAKIKNWISTESKIMNQPHVDTKQKDIELKKMIENFSDEEKIIILEVAHDTTKTANERILAAYMMVLDQSAASIKNLGALAQSPLPDFGPITAHSEAEIRRGQELAVRYMPVDELAKRASTNPEALEALKKLATAGESDEVRRYAQRILKEMK